MNRDGQSQNNSFFQTLVHIAFVIGFLKTFFHFGTSDAMRGHKCHQSIADF